MIVGIMPQQRRPRLTPQIGGGIISPPPCCTHIPRATNMFRQGIIHIMFSVAIAFGTAGSVMAFDRVRIDDGEHESMLLRRAFRKELITSDIALRLAEMVFANLYGREYTKERSPLVVADRGDRWELTSREGIMPGERLRMVIAKTNGRILELVNW